MIMSLVYLYTSYIVHFEYWLLSIAYWCKVGIKLELSSSLKCKLPTYSYIIYTQWLEYSLPLSRSNMWSSPENWFCPMYPPYTTSLPSNHTIALPLLGLGGEREPLAGTNGRHTDATKSISYTSFVYFSSIASSEICPPKLYTFGKGR